MLKQKIKSITRYILNICYPPRQAIRDKEYELKVLYFHEAKPFEHLTTDNLPKPIADSFEHYNSIKQKEYVYKYTGLCWIEPEHGWLLLPQTKKFIPESHPYDFFPKPSPIQRISRYNRIEVEKIISIRYYFNNYWHFHNDVLGQIALAQKVIQDKNIPILVPEEAFRIPFVKELFNQIVSMKEIKWLMQKKDTVVEAKEIFLLKNMPNTSDTFNGIFKLLEYQIQPNFNSTRIYLKRGRIRGRGLSESNAKEVEDAVKTFGYKVIDTDTLSVSEQRYLFANAAHVIGLHGAGLTNLLYRKGAKLHLIEIFPSNFFPPHYYWLCNELGFTYSALFGTKLNSEGRFSISTELLKAELNKLHASFAKSE